MTTTIDLGELYILSNCAKYLARELGVARQNFGQWPAGDLRSFIAESWRFPIVDSHSDGIDFVGSYAANAVTFVFVLLPGQSVPDSVAVVGTFGPMFEPLPMSRVASTPYFAVTVVVPKGYVHTYKFLVDGQPRLDPINPQQVVLDNGQTWSRFFTHLCGQPISFEHWELDLLNRLTARILPFRTEAGENFLKRFYDGLSKIERQTQYAHAYRLDQPVGVVNFIDKLVAKEENHRLADYKTCLAQIDSVLRQRDPTREPAEMPGPMYDILYAEMGADRVPGWDTSIYNSPAFFLRLLRRHTFTGAFSHPKYGGNQGAAGWGYLEERFMDPATDETLFNWRRLMEQPLGSSPDYHG